MSKSNWIYLVQIFNASVIIPEFKVFGLIKLDSVASYYGMNAPDGSDLRASEMVVEACLKADSLVDFSGFDTNSNGEVDMVYLLFAGYSESDNPNHPELIWAHAGVVADSTLLLDGKRIGRYACSSEFIGEIPGTMVPYPERLISTIGNICHEFGHVLGLPDFYNTVSGAGITLGEMSIMDHGNYIEQGRAPAGYSAFEKEMVDWLDVPVLNSRTTLKDAITINDSTIQVSIRPLSDIGERESNSFRAFKIVIPQTNESFYFENRQLMGCDESLPVHGLMIYYADTDNPQLWDTNQVNISSLHFNYNIVRAGGKYSISYSMIPFINEAYTNKIFKNYTNRDRLFHLYNIKKESDCILLTISVECGLVE